MLHIWTKSKQDLPSSSEGLVKIDESNNFEDIVGSGPGRNWVHVNYVDYDPTDDSIIISSRHQSTIIKIERDKQVKLSLRSPEDGNPRLKKRF